MFKNLSSSNPNPNFPSSVAFPRQNDDVSHSHSSDLADISHSDVPHSDYQSISSEFENCSRNSDHPAVETVYHVGFNQDYSCFVMGTNQGFRIYNCDPLSEYCRRDLVAGGGIGIFEMLFRCNIMALVGGGAESEYPKNKLMIWNDHHNNYIGELSFRSDIKAVRLRRDKIVVVLLHKIMVYNFADLKVSHQIETFTNPKGLCQVSQVSGNMVLVCPGLQKGQVRVEHYALRKTKFIVAHDSSIACLALNSDGRLLATASSKGTLIRVFNTLDGSLLQELRRGADRADIYSLAFSSTSQWLAVSSDKGTIHVFSLKVDSGSPGIERSNSSKANSIASAVTNLSFIKGVLPRYFSSEWSVAQFRLPEGGTRYIVAFGHKKYTIVIVGMDGSFYRCEFDPESGGEMKQLEFHNVLKEQERV